MKYVALACLLLYCPSIAAYEIDWLFMGRNKGKLVVDCPNGSSRVYVDLDEADLAALDTDKLADQIKKECGDEEN